MASLQFKPQKDSKAPVAVEKAPATTTARVSTAARASTTAAGEPKVQSGGKRKREDDEVSLRTESRSSDGSESLGSLRDFLVSDDESYEEEAEPVVVLQPAATKGLTGLQSTIARLEARYSKKKGK